MILLKRLLVLFSLFLILFSCVKNNPDPSWLEVNEWTLLENSESLYEHGVLTHNFTDAWVFVDGEIVGVFEVPFKIPILKSGNCNIKIYPTIRNNGISSTKKIYPFVDLFEVDAELKQNETLTLDPTTKYSSNSYCWIEDFEDASIKMENDPNSLASISTESNPEILQYGNFYGAIHLTEQDSIWVGYTNGQLILPKKGAEVYLEVDYHNTNSLITGVLAVEPDKTSPNPNIQLNKQNVGTAEWKKIYIELKEIVSYYVNAGYYEISFQALLESGMTTSDIYIDNIKVVYRQ